MWIKKSNKVLAVIGTVILACVFCNIVLIELAKSRYNRDVAMHLQALIQQQQYLLQRLSKNLLEPIMRRDVAGIVVNLRSYEDLLFALSKQDLSIPLNLSFVSLTAPAQIIGSIGNVDHSALAPDESYYMAVAEHPKNLIFSKPYVKPEMPEYFLCNLGLGIFHNDVYYGQLDVKVALEIVHNYINKKLYKSKIFSFELSNKNILTHKIRVNYLQYLITSVHYTVIELMIIFGGAWLLLFCLRLRRNFKENNDVLIANATKIQLLMHQSALDSVAYQTQYKYGSMQYCLGMIGVKQLLVDLQALNASLAATRNVTLIFPHQNSSNLQFQGDKLRLMQILSGILYEQILLLAPNSTVSVQLLVTDLQKGVQQIQFKFTDDGFYNKLEDRGVTVSIADIRSQGLDNIYGLIDLEDGTLEHQHAAYSGNVITFTIVRKVVQKIVSIESYY